MTHREKALRKLLQKCFHQLVCLEAVRAGVAEHMPDGGVRMQGRVMPLCALSVTEMMMDSCGRTPVVQREIDQLKMPYHDGGGPGADTKSISIGALRNDPEIRRGLEQVHRDMHGMGRAGPGMN